jgi:hypothetical protein
MEPAIDGTSSILAASHLHYYTKQYVLTWVQQHTGNTISSQVNRQALVHNVQRRLAGPIRVATTPPVVINRSYFAADIRHKGFPAKTADEAGIQQLLHHNQWPNRVGFEGLDHVLLCYGF